MLWVRLETKR